VLKILKNKFAKSIYQWSVDGLSKEQITCQSVLSPIIAVK
jgi:hypothetical protein